MIRYTSSPTEYDQALHGTLCTVFLNDEGSKKELYIQVGCFEKPSWIKVSDMFLKVYEKELEDEGFIEECFSKYYQLTRLTR